MVYAANLSEPLRVMHWRLILKEFGSNIQHIAGVDKIVSDILSRFPSTYFDKYKPITIKDQFCVNELFTISGAENSKDCFPLNILNVQKEQQKNI